MNTGNFTSSWKGMQIGLTKCPNIEPARPCTMQTQIMAGLFDGVIQIESINQESYSVHTNPGKKKPPGRNLEGIGEP